MNRWALAIMAKAPLAGQAKTRLATAIGEEAALALYGCFLLDTVATARGVPGADVSLFCPSVEHRAPLRAMLPAQAASEIAVHVQASTGLMDGLAEALGRYLALGYERVALIDADSPTVPVAELRRAFALLAECDLVLGPCMDGGYYLVAATASHPWLFLEVPREPARLCADTLAAARCRGLAARTIAPWYDVDTLADLDRLCAELRADPAVAPRTWSFLEGWRRPDGGA
jgi:rSAM/selenodomain-associated transferase 1